MRHRNAEPHQPDLEAGPGPDALLLMPPGRAVVGQDRPWQPPPTETRDQDALHRGQILPIGGRQGEQVAAVVVDQRQRMHPTLAQRAVAHEVELPQIVGGRPLEPPRGGAGRFGAQQRGVAEDARDRARRRHAGAVGATQGMVDLAATPRGMRPAHIADQIGHRRRGHLRGGVGPPRAIGQPGHAVGGIAAQPFVTGLGADAEAAAQLPHIGAFPGGHHDELPTDFHDGTLLPRHDGASFARHHHAVKSVPYVSEQV